MFRSLSFRLFLISFSFVAVLTPMHASAADEVFVTADGAIHGYDPVAYHTQAKPVRGLMSIVHQWKGATWRFSNKVNRDLFVANPERYAPHYGGYCAFGISQGYKVSIDPNAFAIVDGKLYLNYNKQVQTKWNKDRLGYIVKANQQWNKLEHSAYKTEK